MSNAATNSALTTTREVPTERPHYPVILNDGDDANGVANILATLLHENFERFPARSRVARRTPRPVAVYSTDTEEGATIVFTDKDVVVYNGLVGRPSVTVNATVQQIIDVSQLRMKAGGLVPIGFFTKRGRDVLGSILRHDLVVKGLLTHTVTSLRLIAMLSITE
jgi:hypothetical protein